MGNKNREKGLQDEINNNFEWSLRPLIIFSLVFGIRLNHIENRSRVILAHGLAWIILHLIFNGITFWKTFAKHAVYGKIHVHHIERKENASNIITSVIGVFTFTLPIIGTHLLFITFHRRWKVLWEKLMEIQDIMALDNHFYKKCRRKCWILLFILLLEQMAFFKASLGLSYYGKLPIFPQEFAIFLGNMFHLLFFIIQTIFLVMVAIAVELFRVLKERMVIISKSDFANDKMSKELEKWRIPHELVCRLVFLINHCFSGILVIIFVYASGGIVKYTTHLLNTDHNSWADYYFILFEMYCQLGTILIGSHFLRQAGFEVANSICRMRLPSELPLQVQMNTVYLQVSHSEHSAINTMDMPLSLAMIPIILGKVLEYCIILYNSGSA